LCPAGCFIFANGFADLTERLFPPNGESGAKRKTGSQTPAGKGSLKNTLREGGRFFRGSLEEGAQKQSGNGGYSNSQNSSITTIIAKNQFAK